MREQDSGTQSAPTSSRVQRRWIVMPFVVFALLVIAYLAIWFKARDEALQKFSNWVSAEKARGNEVTYDKAHIIGLPFRFALEIENLQRTESNGKSWKAAGLRINALPYNLQHVIVEALGPQTFKFADGRVWTLSAESAAMSVHWGKRGLLRLSAIVKNAAWTSQDGDKGSLKAYALQITPTDKSATALRFQTEAVDMHLPPLKTPLDAFGPDYNSIHAKGVIDQAQIFKTGFNPGSMDLWSAQKGALIVNSAKLKTPSVDVNGGGIFRLDRLRRPMGQIDIAVPNARAFADTLRKKGWPNEGGAAKAAPAREDIQLRAIDGEVIFWGVPVKDLQPVYSPDLPDASGVPVGAG